MSHQREVNRLLKAINAAKLRKDYKECIELYNVVGATCSDIGSYTEAVYYHEQAVETATTTGDRLEVAIASRYVGEAKAALNDFTGAAECIKRYLDIAQQLNNKLHVQRAHTTLGRVYLMEAEELKNKSGHLDRRGKEAAREAHRRFIEALKLAESVKGQVDSQEHAQMISGLIINLGLVEEICGRHDEAVKKLRRAIEMCRGAKLKEDLYRCQIILTGIHRQRDEVRLAVTSSEGALATAKSIGKKTHICEALIERGLVRICQSDFKNAKRAFAEAYLEKSPNEDDQIRAVKLTKLAHLITITHDKVCRNDITREERYKLCDKLGDLFLAVDNNKLAIEFYRRAFVEAKICRKPRSELAKLLYSIAETYADNRNYKHALACYSQEVEYRENNPKEQCHSLIKMGHMQEYLGHEADKVCETYERALAKAASDPKLMHDVLRFYVPYMKRKSCSETRCRELEEKLENLESYEEVRRGTDSENQQGTEEEEGDEGGEAQDELEDEVPNIDDIITDDDDDDDGEVVRLGRRRRNGHARRYKLNEIGETPLHQACIKGDMKRVIALVESGHEVNPPDHAGWIPLHEAANHGFLDIAEYLIEQGADVNFRGMGGISPLHDAASNGHFAMMRLLIQNGGNTIALGDRGETVLSCLRDYRTRVVMDNREINEFNRMEAELMTIMDRCGYDLMAESNRRNQATTSSAARSTDALVEQLARDHERNAVNPNLLTVNIREYREAMKNAKRKRNVTDVSGGQNKRPAQPPTVQTNSNLSMPTREWILNDNVVVGDEDDDDMDAEDEPRPTNNRNGRNNNNINVNINDGDNDDDDDPVVVSDSRLSDNPQPSTSYATNSNGRVERPRQRQPIVVEPDDDDDGDDDDDVLPPDVQPKRSAGGLIIEEDDDIDDQLGDILSQDGDMQSDIQSLIDLTSAHSQAPSTRSVATFNFSEPLAVTINGKRLLVPIRDGNATIAELKQSIVERYAVLTTARPNISLAPVSDPDCHLFDQDLCRDVVRGELIAKIHSWQLDSIETTYADSCRQAELEPLTYVKVKLRDFDKTGGLVDLAHSRLPHAHLKPVITALARRNFVNANLSGMPMWFELEQIAQEFLESTLTSWSHLNRLDLRCCGLLAEHFELLCNSKSKLAELQYVDLSVNSIAYKSKADFAGQVAKLRGEVCCERLKRLDVSKNHLLFVKSIVSKSAATTSAGCSGDNPAATAVVVVSEPASDAAAAGAVTANDAEAGAATMTDGEPQRATPRLDISRALELADIEILADDQYDYAVYFT